jgi:hypothetical protein
VYILEAHATDEWPIASARFNGGRGAVAVAQPRRDAARLALAHGFAADFRLAHRDGFTLLVDAAEGAAADAFERAYAPWPLRFFGVEGGALSLVAHPRDCGYDPVQLRDWALAAAARREGLHEGDT